MIQRLISDARMTGQREGLRTEGLGLREGAMGPIILQCWLTR